LYIFHFRKRKLCAPVKEFSVIIGFSFYCPLVLPYIPRDIPSLCGRVLFYISSRLANRLVSLLDFSNSSSLFFDVHIWLLEHLRLIEILRNVNTPCLIILSNKGAFQGSVHSELDQLPGKDPPVRWVIRLWHI